MTTDAGSPNAAYRYDPYRNFRFRVKWDGRYVAGVSRVSGLTHPAQVMRRAGADPAAPRRMPGESDYGPITLERGVTCDVAFAQWADKVWDYRNATDEGQPRAADPNVALADFRKDVVIEIYNEAGHEVLAYTVFRCWPSEFIALAELDGTGNAVAIQSLTLQNEGWQRDTSAPEPSQLGSDPPQPG